MKKLILLVCFFLLFGCKVGEFPENRNRLHELGHEKTFARSPRSVASTACNGNSQKNRPNPDGFYFA